MLILQRYPGQSIQVGKDIEIVVLGNSKGLTRIGINAPPNINIVRREIKHKTWISKNE
jgi:carbon storage regulator CsrA